LQEFARAFGEDRNKILFKTIPVSGRIPNQALPGNKAEAGICKTEKIFIEAKSLL